MEKMQADSLAELVKLCERAQEPAWKASRLFGRLCNLQDAELG